MYYNKSPQSKLITGKVNLNSEFFSSKVFKNDTIISGASSLIQCKNIGFQDSIQLSSVLSTAAGKGDKDDKSTGVSGMMSFINDESKGRQSILSSHSAIQIKTKNKIEGLLKKLDDESSSSDEDPN